MTKRPKTTIESVTKQLRAVALSAQDGALLGSEEELLEKLGISRGTFVQAARLLEREGVLRVKRGINGGYFSARPGAYNIERAVSAYLDALQTDSREITMISEALWPAVVARAAAETSVKTRGVTERFEKKVQAVKPDASLLEIAQIELDIQEAIFKLIKCGYIDLIFQINFAFAQRRFLPTDRNIGPDKHQQFVRAWKREKLMELSAIAEGDADLAIMAAVRTRKLLHQRSWTLSNLEATERAASAPEIGD